MRSFQNKILHNGPFINKKLYTFVIKSSPLYSFSNLCDKTYFQIFCKCDRVEWLWLDLNQCFQNSIILTTLIPQTAFFQIFDFASDSISIFNHVLLMFKLCVCPEKKVHNINNLIVAIRKVKRIDRKLVERYSRERSVFFLNSEQEWVFGCF